MSRLGAFGAELRRRRRAAGISLTELAFRVHYSKSQLSKIENGRARPNDTLAALCDREFDAGGILVALVPPLSRRRNRVVLEIRTRLPATADRPATDGPNLGMLLDLPESTTDCVAPGVGPAVATLCGALRLHGLCDHHCLFVDLLAAPGA